MAGYWSKNVARKDRYMFPIVLDFFLANRLDQELLKEVYAPLVGDFTRRHIKYPEDVLKAFQGIMGALTPFLR
jgi:hypothetical protein